MFKQFFLTVFEKFGGMASENNSISKTFIRGTLVHFEVRGQNAGQNTVLACRVLTKRLLNQAIDADILAAIRAIEDRRDQKRAYARASETTHIVAVMGRAAEEFLPILQQGALVEMVGSYRSRSYKDNNGQVQWMHEFIVDDPEALRVVHYSYASQQRQQQQPQQRQQPTTAAQRQASQQFQAPPSRQAQAQPQQEDLDLPFNDELPDFDPPF